MTMEGKYGLRSERAAIEGRFSTQWGSTTPIAWDNVHYTPVPETSFVKFAVLPGTAWVASLGTSPSYRHTGIISINIHTPIDAGTTTAKTLADTASAVFRGWQSGGLVCRSPYITFNGEEDGWYKINVTVGFFRDETF